MSRLLCTNCRDWITGRVVVVDVDGDAQPWCGSCAREKEEREAEVGQEHALGVYKGDGMGEPREEVFEGEDGWYWRKFGGNGEEDDRSTEAYSTKEHAQEGLDRVREQDAERQAAIDAEKAAPAPPQGLPQNQEAPPFDPGQSTPVDDVDAAGLADQVGEVEPKPDYPDQAA